MKSPPLCLLKMAGLHLQDEIGPSAPTPVTDLNCSQDEGLQTISLSSDDDEEKGATSPLAEGGDDSLDLHEDSFPGLGANIWSALVLTSSSAQSEEGG